MICYYVSSQALYWGKTRDRQLFLFKLFDKLANQRYLVSIFVVACDGHFGHISKKFFFVSVPLQTKALSTLLPSHSKQITLFPFGLKV